MLYNDNYTMSTGCSEVFLIKCVCVIICLFLCLSTLTLVWQQSFMQNTAHVSALIKLTVCAS